MDQDHLGAVVLHQFPALFADRIRHDDLRLIAAHGPHQSQTDPLVAAGGLHDDRILVDQPLFFRFTDHIVRGPRLDGAAHVQPLELDQDLRAVLFHHAVQADQRRISHCF